MNKTGIISSNEFAVNMLNNWENILLWNKLFSAEVLDGIRLEEGHCIDDEFFTYKVVIKSKKIEMVDNCLYHYRNRKNSAMNNPDKQQQRLDDQIEYITKRYKPLCNAYPELKNRFLEQLLGVLMMVMKKGTKYPVPFVKAKRKLFRYGILSLLNPYVDLNIRKSVIFYLLNPTQKIATNDIEINIDNFFD